MIAKHKKIDKKYSLDFIITKHMQHIHMCSVTSHNILVSSTLILVQQQDTQMYSSACRV